MPTHHTAIITKAMVMATFMVIPILSYISTSTKEARNGTQLPMYPQAYPWEDTSSIRFSVVCREAGIIENRLPEYPTFARIKIIRNTSQLEVKPMPIQPTTPTAMKATKSAS